jgi:succinylarginine dihydrolase
LPVTWNFDGLPGPTHNYAGLAEGNLAASRNARLVADPRSAARQGLAKMRALAARGYPQAVLPPHERPDVHALRALGFAGTDAEVILRAGRDAPRVLAACASAAAMWEANAATVSASPDTADGRVHFTPANLAAHFHRTLEVPTTTRVLRALFADPAHFVVHEALPPAAQFGDEGAANHTRLEGPDGRGIECFVYGRAGFGEGLAPSRFPARQTREASEAVARRHGLDAGRTVLVQQSPAAIDAGVFHNDVIAVGERTLLFCHEGAFVDQPAVLEALRQRVGPSFEALVVAAAEVPLDDAVSTYLFNSQLLSRPDGRYTLVAPAEAQEHPRTRALLERLVGGAGPIGDVMVFDLRQSMRNGGGPACLRLRVPLTGDECTAVRGRVFVDESLAQALEAWIGRHYRDRIAPEDLADPALLDESRRALDELTTLLELPALYPFQREAG